jgi:hypothetical protein
MILEILESNQSHLKKKTAKRRPAIWYYTKEKKGNMKELNLNLIEVTVPWNDVVINIENFSKKDDIHYKMSPCKVEDIM